MRAPATYAPVGDRRGTLVRLTAVPRQPPTPQLLLTGGLVLPALLGLVATFTTYSPFSAAVRFIGVNNYLAVFHDHVFTAAVRNIAVFTVVAVPLELVIGFGLAYLLRHPIRGRALWRVLLLMPWLISPIAN